MSGPASFSLYFSWQVFLCVSSLENILNLLKVWYHKCPSRGKYCNNTKLVEHGGCSIWYDEVQVRQSVYLKCPFFSYVNTFFAYFP